MFSVTPIPAFDDNYIWLLRSLGDKRCAVVDPGDEDPVLEVLQREGLQLAAILITHKHGDHTGGIRGLKAEWPDAVVYGPAGEPIPLLERPLSAGDAVTVAGLDTLFAVLEVPGHTEGHIAYLGDGALFCGDTLFACGCGRVFSGTHEQLSDSLAQNAYGKRERLAAIEGEWVGLPRATVRAGFETAEVDYVNGRQLQVVQPSVNTTTINLRARPVRDLKVQADFRRRRVDERPLAYDIAGQPTTTRIWSEADMLRFRATYTPGRLPIGLTAGYRSDDRQNPNQGTSNQIITRDLTAWWMATEGLTATASFLEQDFGLRGVGLATPYVSDSRSWSLGATWQATDRTSLDASFTRADSFGSVELREDTWSLSLDHAWDKHRVRLGWVLDDLDDFNGTLLGYDADLLYAEFSTQLP